MVEGDSGADKGREIEVSAAQNGSDRPALHTESSFSGWFDEDGIQRFDRPPNGANANLAYPHLELALVEEERGGGGLSGQGVQHSSTFRHRNMHLNGGHVLEDGTLSIEGVAEERKFLPFHIQSDSGGGESRVSDVDSDISELGRRNDARSSFPIAMVLKTSVFVLIWYIASTCLTLYNKTLLGEKLGNFPAPMLMNTVHFTMQAVLSRIIVRFCSQKMQPTVDMSWKDYFMRVVPTALGTALDINLSNASLVFISVTFATMCKSASPIFLLLFAFAFKLESPSIKLLGIILIISLGILLTVAKETEFEFWGFVFVMLAAVMSGFRWSMTQILLQKEAYGLKHPLALMAYVTPVMAAATALSSLIMDPWAEFKKNNYFNNSWHIARSCMLMVIGGSLAFLMVLTEYILVSETSAVTVTIAGVVKEAVTILVAVFYFHDEFTWMKGIGLITIMVGVSLFNWYKYQKLQKGPTSENAEEMSPSPNAAAKYVILENMDEQEED